jgi:hypothetical protein
MPKISFIGYITFVSYPVERFERDFADFDIANCYCDLKFRQVWILYRREINMFDYEMMVLYPDNFK